MKRIGLVFLIETKHQLTGAVSAGAKFAVPVYRT